MKSEKIPQNLPRHIAFIMDGNGRWAKKRFLPRKAGHREGVKTMRRIVDECFKIGIPYLTVYAFSTENKNRPQDEVEALFNLMEEYFTEFLNELLEKNICVRTMGDTSYFPETMRNMNADAIEKSASCTGGTLNIALNYGSRDEILRAVNVAVKNGAVLDSDAFSRLLYTSDLPDPDLVVRTGGESRLSNFMLYQCAYSELFFTKTLWPDFNKTLLYEILNDYSARERRFGKVKP